MLPHARNPFQLQDLQLVARRRGCWNERLGRESDHFAKAFRGKERDIRKGFVSLLGESVVPEHDVQEPARFAQTHDGSDISRREWSGGVDDQLETGKNRGLKTASADPRFECEVPLDAIALLSGFGEQRNIMPSSAYVPLLPKPQLQNRGRGRLRSRNDCEIARIERAAFGVVRPNPRKFLEVA